LQRFRQEARAALLEGYAEGGGDAVPPVNAGLLAVFTLEKAAYEIAYEAANRPDWIGVPLQGLADLTNHIKEGL